jgi:choline-glycine betaine transporter
MTGFTARSRVSQRLRPPTRTTQAVGLALTAGGLVALAASSPLHSLAVVLLAAVAVGLGHGVGFLNAQDELNAIAPADRRAEVTSAFISCIYLVVAAAVVAGGLVDGWRSLSASVGAVALALAAVAVVTGACRAVGSRQSSTSS